MVHTLEVPIYYEDTDHSGLVYHANYLKYFERAREHLLGRVELLRLLDEDGIGFVVYKAELTYRRGARFGDTISVRTSIDESSDYRVRFNQDAYRGEEQLVAGKVELVCVDAEGQLVPLPPSVVGAITSHPK